MARVSVEKAWLVQGAGKGLDAAIDGALREHGMTATHSAGKLDMRGGSQLKMRTLGGLFTKDSVLPRAGTLERSPEASSPGVERITLHLEDKMGFGLMDPKMKQKYQRILESVAFSIEAAVTGNVSAIRDAKHGDSDWTDPSKPDSAGSSATVSISDELDKLVGLRERGVLSETEFDAAKRKLLS